MDETNEFPIFGGLKEILTYRVNLLARFVELNAPKAIICRQAVMVLDCLWVMCQAEMSKEESNRSHEAACKMMRRCKKCGGAASMAKDKYMIGPLCDEHLIEETALIDDVNRKDEWHVSGYEFGETAGPVDSE